MGQGRGGFYTHAWIENLLGADFHNADRTVPGLQRLAVGDTVRLTPDPYLGHPGQFMTVAKIEPQRICRRLAKNAASVSGSMKGYERDRHGKKHRGQRETADTTVL
jgi:hypothetical protein